MKNYSEKIIYLPDTFQANDSRRKISDRGFSRAEVVLPENAFVFCSFNNSYKITPAMFDVWMRLLQKVDGTVLWLVGGNTSVERNLKKEAQRRGVDSGRLIFCSRVAYPEYLARYRLADLFLDTFPFNGGTTASDALWAGLPLISCAGDAFASRMAGSLLMAIGMPEMVAQSLPDYEAIACKLAGNPDLMSSAKRKLAQNRGSYPLFDTLRFTKHIEAAYIAAHERYQVGLPRDHIYVAQ
jgi:predicted O-linked N-acetylglucosamine transferase (SPINDLY family)